MPVRIALANLPFPESPQASVQAVLRAVEQAASGGATIVCFPECFVPGYRSLRRALPPPDAGFLETAWAAAARSAARAGVTLVLGTERLVNGCLVPSSVVIAADGSIAGFQDKVQIDPSEEGTYTAGTERRVFQAGALVFGVVICHEGWRYPETVRWAARRGAHIVFHQQFHEAEERLVPADLIWQAGEHVSRERCPVPGRREHLLLRDRELRQCRQSHHIGSGQS